MNTDNPSYITISEMLGKYYAVRMEYDGDSYRVAKTGKARTGRGQAWIDAEDWAKRDKLEVR